MAAVLKETASALPNHLKHNTRGFETKNEPNNPDINPEKTDRDYSFPIPKKGEISVEPCEVIPAKESLKYHRERMAELYHMKRKDVVVAIEWDITLPKELSKAPEEVQLKFFQESFKFLCGKYGSENCIQAVVHRDEGILDKNGSRIIGEDHMHAVFIPVTKTTTTDPKRTESKFTEKVNAKGVLTQNHLKTFHPHFQRYLDENTDLNCKVHTGVTGGKNRTVEQLKETTRLQEKIKALEAENQQLKEKIKTLETTQEKETVKGWGTQTSSQSGWGSYGGKKW